MQKSNKKRKKKPHRPCMFCGNKSSAISRHIANVHKNEEVVKDALTKPKKDRISIFNSLKKKGIEIYNLKQLKEEKPNLLRERSNFIVTKTSPDELVMCSICKGFFSRTYFCRHKAVCGEAVPPCALKLSKIANVGVNCSEEFKQHVLNKLREDEVGDICRSDKVSLSLGKYHMTK